MFKQLIFNFMNLHFPILQILNSDFDDLYLNYLTFPSTLQECNLDLAKGKPQSYLKWQYIRQAYTGVEHNNFGSKLVDALKRIMWNYQHDLVGQQH